MNSVAAILESAFERARNSGREIEKGAAAEAELLRISTTHYSRLKNGRVPLTDRFIDRVVELFAEGDETYARKLEEDLRAARGASARREVAAAAPPARGLDKYAVESAAGGLFDKLCNDKSMLVVCYRDLPQAVERGAYPAMARKAREALSCGLRMALCQPFGSAESLLKKQKEVAGLIDEFGLHDRPQALSFSKAYLYLYELATSVRRFYEKMLEEGGPGKGQVVLYEADVENPQLVACGIQTRLFFTDYPEGARRWTKLYEWVAVAGEEHFFVERSERSLDIDAVKLQFNPIPAFWDKYERLPEKEDMEEAYAEFGLESLFGKNEGEVRWKVWSK